ncbi:MAG: glycosyltransferase, partial [Oceanivirga sp.]|nr:glycosyltransferase [Oceanivirga sp.]
MNKKNYKISVCLASYNGEKYIKEQIESILVQLKPNDELVISDDYSTDNTLGIIKSLNDPNKISITVGNGINSLNTQDVKIIIKRQLSSFIREMTALNYIWFHHHYSGYCITSSPKTSLRIKGNFNNNF